MPVPVLEWTAMAKEAVGYATRPPFPPLPPPAHPIVAICERSPHSARNVREKAFKNIWENTMLRTRLTRFACKGK